MKKTLIALLSLSGMAGAAITDGQTSYKGWDSASDASYGGSVVLSGGADGNGYLDGTASAISLHMNDGYTAPSNSFTLAFKVRNLTDVVAGGSALASIAPFDTNDVWLQTSIRTDSNGAITLVNTTNSEETKTTILTLSSDSVNVNTLTGDEWVSVILIGDENGLTLNVNGVSGTVEYDLSTKDVCDFQFAGVKYRGAGAKAEFDDLAFWNRALTEDEVAYLAAGNLANGNSKLVPEPTTATLSLLALAGLAARRRRK